MDRELHVRKLANPLCLCSKISVFSEGIISYMKKQAGPSAKELADVEAVKKFIDNEEHSIIGEFSNG